MVAKCVGLMIIVIGGIITLVQGNYGSLYNLESAFADTKLGISTIGMALYQCLWSYAGWQNLNNVTEEVKMPEVRLSLLQCHDYVQCFNNNVIQAEYIINKVSKKNKVSHYIIKVINVECVTTAKF